jgi:hypothetical protein
MALNSWSDCPMTSPDIALPDRLSVDPDSPFHDEALLAKGIGIRFNGVEKTNVEEYCLSEGLASR